MGSGLWRDRDFRLFWFGETISTAGSAMAVVAMPLTAVLVLHSSTLVVGLLQATAWLPAVLIGLPAGAWVDRRRKRPVMLACDIAAFALFASVPVAAWTGVLTIGQLVAVAFLAGSAAVFFTASYGAFVRSVVSADRRMEANAKLEGSVWAAQMAGPGLGGLAAQLLGAVSGLFANALSFIVSAVCLTGSAWQNQRRSRARRTPRCAPRSVTASGSWSAIPVCGWSPPTWERATSATPCWRRSSSSSWSLRSR
jgi:MFS family permease